MVFIVVIGILMSYAIVRKKGKTGGLLDMLLMAPYVIPGSVLGLCYIVTFNVKPLILTGTAAIIIISYIIRKLPYTVRSASAFLMRWIRAWRRPPSTSAFRRCAPSGRSRPD